MDEFFRRYPKGNTRQLVDYNNVIEKSGKRQFLCLDRGVIEILRYALNSRFSWRTSFYTSLAVDGYTIPNDAQWDILEELIAEGNTQMTDCEDIVDAINGIKLAIEAATPTIPSGGCGCVASGDTDITDVGDVDNEPIPLPSEFEEAGFSTEEAYNSHRCEAANYIITNYIQTLNNWGGLFGMTGGLTIAVIAGLLLLTVPPIGLMAIVAALGVLAGIDIGLLVKLTDIATELSANKPTILCDLYNAEDTATAVGVIQTAASDAVIASVDPALVTVYTTVTNNLINNVVIGDMFNPSGKTLAPADCSACGEACVVDYEVTLSGTETSDNPSNPITGTMGLYPSGPVLSCTTNARAFYVSFDTPVVITAVNTSVPPVPCGAEPRSKYWTGPNFTGDFTESEALPQEVLGGFSQTFGFVINGGGSEVDIEIHYICE